MSRKSNARHYPTADTFAHLLLWRQDHLAEQGRPNRCYEDYEFDLLTARAELAALAWHLNVPGTIAAIDQACAESTDIFRRIRSRSEQAQEWYFNQQFERLERRFDCKTAVSIVNYAQARVRWESARGALPLEKLEELADLLPEALAKVLQILAEY